MAKQRRVGSGSPRVKAKSSSAGSLLGGAVVVIIALGVVNNLGKGSPAVAEATPTPTMWAVQQVANPSPAPTLQPVSTDAPGVSPTLEPSPTATIEPTPTPAPTPVVVVVDDLIEVTSDSKSTFRGKRGDYTWSFVSFDDEKATLNWTLTAGSTSCRVDWSFTDEYGGVLERRLWAAAGEKATGSKRYTTDWSSGEVEFVSTCPSWTASLKGYIPPPDPTPKPASGGSCHPSYRGACLKQGIGDYDCAGGSGNGPNYVAGPISVVGYDEFDLDRDNDGIGCE